jgi:hypothetical protein
VHLRLIRGAGHDLDTSAWTGPLADGTSFLLKEL